MFLQKIQWQELLKFQNYINNLSWWVWLILHCCLKFRPYSKFTHMSKLCLKKLCSIQSKVHHITIKVLPQGTLDRLNGSLSLFFCHITKKVLYCVFSVCASCIESCLQIPVYNNAVHWMMICCVVYNCGNKFCLEITLITLDADIA